MSHSPFSSSDDRVIRDGTKTNVSVKDIVPGDVVLIKPGVVYSDMAIVKSEHMVVDESALTGESNPIAKVAFDETMRKVEYDINSHKVHTLFAGTNVIDCSENGNELGIVLATGSSTTKGNLLSDILSYQRHKFLFDDEVKIVLLIFLVQGIILLSLVFTWLAEQFVYAWFYGMYIVATILPPLLPTVFVVSVGISANRLQQHRIACTNSEGILVAGKVDVCCFDKTGTLTQSGMDFVGVDTSDDKAVKNQTYIGLAVCHSLKMSGDGTTIGNSVDKACFEASGGLIRSLKGESVRIEHNGVTYTVLKQFDFDNHSQTQSVIVVDERGRTIVFTKGSPEAIRSRCLSSNVPEHFEHTLTTNAKSGVYQLAIAFKEYEGTEDIAIISRQEVESRLTFGGFINFRNFIRKTTPEIIKELNNANILVTMITGDSVLTGISIAREAGIVNLQSIFLGQLGIKNDVQWQNVDNHAQVDTPNNFHPELALAITGEAWSALLDQDPEYAYKIARYVRVFGRCNPTDKVSVVTVLGHQGYVTMMCGDGQNDCGALKSAHVGVALSSSDASIVAPFTSLDKDLQSVILILREGRCALSSAFKAYSFYVIYGQVETYLQTINAYLAITFSEWCWIFLDGIWSAGLVFSLPLAHAAKKLYNHRPTSSLLGIRTVSSVGGMVLINFFFTCLGMIALNKQDWYQCRKWNSEDVSNALTIGDNYESTTLFIVGGYQIVASAFALNFGYKFRAPWFTNHLFMILFTVFTIFHVVVILYPSRVSCIFRINCDNEVRSFVMSASRITNPI
jgi:predicted P-type ATPase